MRICPPHWQQLRGEIQSRRMWHLVPENGEEANQALIDGQFDPLISATHIIMSSAIGYGGLAVTNNNDDGSERCPVCYGMGFNSEWEECIVQAADSVMLYAREQGFISIS